MNLIRKSGTIVRPFEDLPAIRLVAQNFTEFVPVVSLKRTAKQDDEMKFAPTVLRPLETFLKLGRQIELRDVELV